MDRLMQNMRQEALRAVRGIAEPRIGIITSYDPNTHRAKVNIMPEAADLQPGETAETDWLPIATPLVGAGWGIYAPPSPGEQVLIVHQEHNHGAGIIVGRVNSQGAPAPSVPSGEVWLRHQTGSMIQLLNANNGDIILTHSSGSYVSLGQGGQITATHNNGASVVLLNTGEAQLNGSAGNYVHLLADGTNVIVGDTLVQGSLTWTGTGRGQGDVYDFHGSLNQLREHYDIHVHTGVQNGGGSTSTTTAPD